MKVLKKVKSIVVLSIVSGLIVLSGCTSTTSSSTATPVSTAKSTANSNLPLVAITQIADHPALDTCRENVIKALEEAGYKDGVNIRIEYKSAQGDVNNAVTIAQDFVNKKAAVIIAIATPSAQAALTEAKKAGIPLVFCAVSDPVAAGLATDTTHGVSGVTGTSDKLPVKEQLELIKKISPNTKKIGILHNTAEANSDSQLAEAKTVAKQLGLEIVDKGVTNSSEIATALDTLLPQVDCIYNLTDNLVVSSLSLVLSKANAANKPVYGSEDSQVTNGCLASVGINYSDLGKDTGAMAAKILKGEKAENISIITKLGKNVTINETTASKLNITIPSDIKSSATIVK